MKKTGALKVLKSSRVTTSEFSIHPNDGFDLGLMTTQYEIQVFHGVSLDEFTQGKGAGTPAKLKLLNECPKESFEVHPKVWESLGSPKTVILIADGMRILVQGH